MELFLSFLRIGSYMSDDSTGGAHDSDRRTSTDAICTNNFSVRGELVPDLCSHVSYSGADNGFEQCGGRIA